jgi:hypothetical protein
MATVGLGAIDRPSPQGPGHDGFSVDRGWQVSLGSAYRDTMSFGSCDVLPVAAAVLARDRWSIQSADSATGRIITEWQPVRHWLARLFLGNVRERCVVDVTPLSPNRCIVEFRAGLATRKSIAGSPLLPKVRREYERGVIAWQAKVKRALAHRTRGA